MSLATPTFTRRMIGMSPRVFLLYNMAQISILVAPVALMLIEQRIFNLLGLATQWHSIWWVMLGYVGIMVVKLTATLLVAWSDVTFRYRIIGALQANALIATLRRPGAVPLPVSALEAINRLRDDVDEVADFPLWIPEVIGTSLAAGVAFALMYHIDAWLSITVAIPLVLLGVIARLLWGRYLHYRYAAGAIDDRYSSQLGSIIAAAQTLKLTASVPYALQRLHALGGERRRINVWGNALHGALAMAVDVGMAATSGVVLWYGSQAIARGDWGVGDLLLLLSGIGVIGWWPNVIATFIGDYAQQRVSIDRLQAFAPEHAEALIERRQWWRADAPDAPPFAPVILPPLRTLSLHQVSYRHDHEHHGIHDVSLQIPAGSVTVIVGATGSGRSTLLNLIAGLLPPQQGVMTWNDEPVTQLGAPSVMTTTQVPFLLSDTLRTNITLGRAVSADELARAVTLAQLDSDSAQLPQGLDTVVGPRGVRLSGGQRQRVAFARMLLHTAELWVLDDVTSAVDGPTEAALWAAIRQAHHGAIVTTSHRRFLLQQADQIVFLAHGRIQAIGTLETLLREQVLMQELWAEMR